MLTSFVLISAASFMSWQMLKTIVFFPIPGRLAYFIVLGFCYLWSLPFDHRLLLAFASSTGVALIIKVIEVEGPEHWKIPSVSMPQRKKPRAWPPGTGGQPEAKNIPKIKRTDIGSRIPDLPKHS